LKEYPKVIEETIERLLLWDREIYLHQEANKYQRVQYKNQLKSLQIGEMFVIADYSVQETKNEGKVSILTLSVIQRKESQGNIINYHDFFFNRDNTTKSETVLARAWRKLFEELVIPTRLFIWSDRGRKNFINQDVLQMYQNISSFYELNINYSTFESKHGHSICDGHFGVAKTKVREDINQESSSLHWTKEFVMESFGKVKNTIVTFLDLDEGENFESITSIKLKNFDFRYFSFEPTKLKSHYFTPNIFF